MNKTAVPKLRFPEFLDEPAWDKKKIGDLVIESPRPIEMQDEEEYSLITVKRRYGGVVSRDTLQGKSIKVKSQFLVKENDFVISKRQIVHNACGLVPKELDGSIVSNEYSVLIPQKNCDIVFFNYFSQQPQVSKSFLLSSVGIVIEKMLFKLDTWLSKKFYFPTLLEQQKIADCLTSLDELITAQSQKVEALQAYKKGLMQNFFPAEGESVPRLRFPEFESAGKWEEVNLGDLGTLVLGLTYSPSDIRDNGLLVLRSSNIKDGVIVLDDCVYVTPDIKRANLSKPNDILICVRNGSTALIGKNAIIPEGMPLCTHGAFMTVFRAKMPKFAYQLLQTEAYQNQVAAGLGARINSINNSQLVNYRFFVPKLLEERQKIAELLTAIDEQIAAQSKTVEMLKSHKKGLMQGLFPSMDEG